VPNEVKLTPEDLHVSAATVGSHAVNVQAKHFTADNRMDATPPTFTP
jgi:hypothetical protein